MVVWTLDVVGPVRVSTSGSCDNDSRDYLNRYSASASFILWMLESKDESPTLKFDIRDLSYKKDI